MNVSSWHVLVVEDEFDSIQVVSKILRHHGAEVSIAHDGKECLKLLEEATPTLIIMDLAMPEMDGWETLAAIRNNPSTSEIPVVAITAYHSVNVQEDARRAGFNAYYPKPIDANNVINQLNKVISEHE